MAIRQIHSIWHDFTKSLGMRSSEAQLLIMMLSLVYWSVGWFVILSFGLTLICGTRNREEKEKAVKTRKREEKTYKDAEKKEERKKAGDDTRKEVYYEIDSHNRQKTS